MFYDDPYRVIVIYNKCEALHPLLLDRFKWGISMWYCIHVKKGLLDSAS